MSAIFPDMDVPVLDNDQLDVLRDLDGADEDEPPFIFEAAEMFFESARQHFATMEAEVLECQGENEEEASARLLRFSKAAHALKGTSANMGAQRLSKVFAELQRSGERGEQGRYATFFLLMFEIESYLPFFRCAQGLQVAKEQYTLAVEALKDVLEQEKEKRQ